MNTRSRTGGVPSAAASRIALTRRRSRFRITALPMAEETVMPTRVWPRPSAMKSVKKAPERRFPRRVTRAKSLRRRSDVYALTALDAEAVTPLLAARGDHATAVLRAHAFEETVHAFTATVMRLKCPLHDGTPCLGAAAYNSIVRGTAQSRTPARMRNLLGLSTSVERAVDNVASAAPKKPAPMPIPAARRANFRHAKKGAKARNDGRFPRPEGLWISGQNGGHPGAGSERRRANPRGSFFLGSPIVGFDE